MLVRRRTRSRVGFTLIEMMMAIFFAACIAVLGATLIPVSKQGQLVAAQYSEITQLAQTKLDRIRELGFGRMNADDMIDAEVCNTKTAAGACTFTVSATDTRVQGATGTVQVTAFNADIRKATVTFSWMSHGSVGKAHTFTVETLVARQ